MTWCSINCAYARLAQIVGLNRVVDTTYRMAQSPYLYPGQPETDRDPIAAVPSYCHRRQRDVPARHGLGRPDDRQRGPAPRAVLRRVHRRLPTASGVYTHDDPGTQVLDRGVALQAVDVLKGVLTNGTGRRYPLNVPGRRQDRHAGNNTNAWFVGFTPQLTTAVWVGDPDGYTPMVNVPEFDQERVQGGRYPTQIWQDVHEHRPRLPARQRLGGAAGRPARRSACTCRATSASTWSPATTRWSIRTPRRRRPHPEQPAGFASPEAPPTTVPPGTTVPAPPAPPATVQVPVYSRVESGDDDPAERARPARPDQHRPARLPDRCVLTDDLLELQRIDTATDQLAHRRANLAERAAAEAAAAELARTTAPDRRR